MSDYLCNDCLDTGWIEDREGKTVCACISETEPYQLLRAEVEAWKQRKSCDTCVRQRGHVVCDNCALYYGRKPCQWIPAKAALRGEGE